VASSQRRFIPYRRLLKNKSAWPRILGVITCKMLREDSYKERFLRVRATIATKRFAVFVRRHKLYLAVTAGSCDRLDESWPSVLDARKCRLEASAPGVIQLANLVVFGFCRAVLFFNDSEDLYADSPQNLALRRLCNTFNVPLLEDVASIQFVLDRWYRKFPEVEKSPDAIRDRNRQLNDYFSNDEVILSFTGRSDRSRETLAIIAHDGKKMEMLRFCAGHIHEILAYRRVLTTGTTGAKLRDLYTEILTLSQDLRKAFGIRNDRKEIRRFVERKICPFKSGPAGGDIQISSKVIEGSCHRVIFFEDPASAHPHQFDIRLLEKAVQSDRTETLFATSTEMAEVIV
jgi:methylglyoxal synthase